MSDPSVTLSILNAVRECTPSIDGYYLRRLAYLGSRYGPESLVRYSPSFWGAALGLVLTKRRRRIRQNLRRVHGPRGRFAEEVDALRTFARYAHCLAESLGAERTRSGMSPPRLVGETALAAELERGRGAVLVTAHTGFWDVAARMLAQRLNREVVVVMQREGDARARELHDVLRTRSGVRVVHVDHPVDGIGLLRHVRKGGVVAIQIDRVPSGIRSIQVELFGMPFGMPQGPFHLAATAQVPIIPVFTRRCGYFEYEISFGKPHRLPPRAAAGAMERAARAIGAELAQFVLAHPNDWFPFNEG